MGNISKPTVGATGWNTAVDTLIDDHNANPFTNGNTDLSGAVVGAVLAASAVDGSNNVTAAKFVAGMPWVNVLDQAGANLPAKMQAAITAVAALAPGGGRIVIPPGTHQWTSGSVPAIPPNLTGRIHIHGAARGATKIVLSASTPRFLDLAKTADGDTVGNVTVEDLTIDCNGVAGSGKNGHVIVGNFPNATVQTKVNIRGVSVRRVNGLNAPVDQTLANNRFWIQCATQNAQADAQNTILDCVVEDCELSGGNYGVSFGAARSGGSTGDYANVFVDRIAVRRVRHDMLTVSTAATHWASAHVHLVGRGMGGANLLIEDCWGRFSGDVGIEVDNPQHATVRNCVVEDAQLNAFYAVNYSPVQAAGNHVLYEGCEARRTVFVPPVGDTNHGIAFNIVPDASGYGTPNATIRDCSWYRNTSDLIVNGEAITANSPRLVVDNFRAVMTGINTTDTTVATMAPFHVGPASGGESNISMRDLSIQVAGAKGASAANILWYGVTVEAPSGKAFLDLDGIDIDWQITSPNTNSCRGAVFFVSGDVGGRLRRLRWKTVPTDTGARGVACNSGLTFTRGIVISDSDFSNLPSGTAGERIVPDSAAQLGVRYGTGNKYKTIAAQTSQTPGAAPWVYQNTSGLRQVVCVSAGTVQSIRYSHDAGTTTAETGQTFGAFPLDHGEYLRINYSSTPTVITFPLVQ